MKKIFFITTILVVVFLFVPFKSFAAVVINEVLYDPDGVDTGKEYIRLYNNSDSAVDLTNWDLDPSDAAYFTFPSFTLIGKSFVNIHIGSSGTNTNTDLYNNGSTNMSNTKGPIALFNSTTHSQTTIVDYIEYGAGNQTNESKAVAAGIWTVGDFIPDVNEGKAIKLKIDGIDNNSPDDWTETNPSIIPEEPEQESIPEQPETPVIPTGNNPPIADAGNDIIGFIGQEIKFDGTKSSDPDGDELAFSWNMGDGKLIEEPSFTYKYLYPGTYLVTLMIYDGRNYVSDTITVKIQNQGITINEFIPNPIGKDEEEEWVEIYNDSNSIADISGWQLDDEASGSHSFVFPQNTLIAPKSYIVFPRQITGIALNNDHDSVRLLLPEGVVFQEITYENPKEGMSSARSPEGFVWSAPTPGMPNIAGVIISENKEVIYQYQIKPEATKESSQDYAVQYQNKAEREIEGGYTTITIGGEQKKVAEQEQSPSQQSQLAMIKEGFSNKSQTNLIFIIFIIIAGGLVVGLLLVRFLKKSP